MPWASFSLLSKGKENQTLGLGTMVENMCEALAHKAVAVWTWEKVPPTSQKWPQQDPASQD